MTNSNYYRTNIAPKHLHRRRGIKNIWLSFLSISLFFVIILQKNVFNDEADVSGSFASSREAYIVAASTIIFIIANFIYYFRSTIVIPKSIFLMLLFYLWALAFSPFSALPYLSAFRALSGLGLVVIAYFVALDFLGRNLEYALNKFYNLLLITAAAMTIGTYMFNINILGSTNPFLLRAGAGSLIFFFLSLWHFTSFLFRGQFRELALMIIYIAIGLSLNSFSALLSFVISAIFILFMSRRFLLFLVFSVLLFISIIVFLQYINLNIDSVVFNKPARTYLIGSGRFPLYEYAVYIYEELPLARKLVGVGFMAERELFVGGNLTWSTNLHNSFLSNLLGVGLFGFFISIIYTIYPFLVRRRVSRYFGPEITLKWIGMHFLFILFGFTSIDYPSQPSWILFLFLIFTTIITTNIGILNRKKRLGKEMLIH